MAMPWPFSTARCRAVLLLVASRPETRMLDGPSGPAKRQPSPSRSLCRMQSCNSSSASVCGVPRCSRYAGAATAMKRAVASARDPKLGSTLAAPCGACPAEARDTRSASVGGRRGAAFRRSVPHRLREHVAPRQHVRSARSSPAPVASSRARISSARASSVAATSDLIREPLRPPDGAPSWRRAPARIQPRAGPAGCACPAAPSAASTARAAAPTGAADLPRASTQGGLVRPLPLGATECTQLMTASQRPAYNHHPLRPRGRSSGSQCASELGPGKGRWGKLGSSGVPRPLPPAPSRKGRGEICGARNV